MKLSAELNRKIVSWKRIIESKFGDSQWRELGMATNCYELVADHPRLLRSMAFCDDDYSGHILSVLREIVQSDTDNVAIIERFLDDLDQPEGDLGATETKIVCRPRVFKAPAGNGQKDLVAVMMPFAKEFDLVYKAIKAACDDEDFECQRVDEIWNDSVVIQDVFDLIYDSWIVVVDFTDKNSNVMYETGIAHTLGRHVVPISQSLDHVPFDLQHHRVVKYLSNPQGLRKLQEKLISRLVRIGHLATAST